MHPRIPPKKKTKTKNEKIQPRKILTVIKISPGIVGFDDEIAVVENRKAVDDVGTDRWVNVFWLVFAQARSVPRPVGEVTHHHVVSCGREGVE